MDLTIVRDLDDVRCSAGTLTIYSTELQSLERPWRAPPDCGEPGRSCVPLGTYQLVRHDTEAHPRSFAIVNEALGVYHYNIPAGALGRSACVIHVANRPEELRGCIALGLVRARAAASWELRESQRAIDKFYALVPWIDGHTLTIQAAA